MRRSDHTGYVDPDVFTIHKTVTGTGHATFFGRGRLQGSRWAHSSLLAVNKCPNSHLAEMSTFRPQGLREPSSTDNLSGFTLVSDFMTYKDVCPEIGSPSFSSLKCRCCQITHLSLLDTSDERRRPVVKFKYSYTAKRFVGKACKNILVVFVMYPSLWLQYCHLFLQLVLLRLELIIKHIYYLTE